MLHSTPRGDRLVVVKVVTNQQDHLTTTAPLYVSTFKNNMMIFDWYMYMVTMYMYQYTCSLRWYYFSSLSSFYIFNATTLSIYIPCMNYVTTMYRLKFIVACFIQWTYLLWAKIRMCLCFVNQKYKVNVWLCTQLYTLELHHTKIESKRLIRAHCTSICLFFFSF